ncbi:MAG: PEP-CTERM sorting domain-containing protein [Verrucomicrobia bacterium]|nr:PEP-CTERM sorting domain-containing protein [Verrucomicrobiota bacterium]MCH8511233.1 PEP-CTERM sorting domain-containing protein [Kiritimatiellia bacterium]
MNTQKFLAPVALLLCAAAFPLHAQTFTSAQAGAFHEDATWLESGNPSIQEGDTVTIGHHVHVLNTADPTGDILGFTGTGGILEPRANGNTTFNAASLNLSAANNEFRSGRVGSGNGVNHTFTLNGAGDRLLLGGGRTTTLNVGENTNLNSGYQITLNSGNNSTTTLDGTHTFVLNNNGTGLGVLNIQQRVNRTSGNHTMILQGDGQLRLQGGTNFTSGDLIDIQGGSVRLDNTSGGTIRFSTNGATLHGRTGTIAANLDFQANGTLSGSAGGDSNPTYTGLFTGSGSITMTGGQFRQRIQAAAGSTWNGELILGTGGRGGVDILNGNLTPTQVTLTGNSVPSNLSDNRSVPLNESTFTGYLRLETSAWTVPGITTAGNGVNTAISSRGSGTRTLTLNPQTGMSYAYDGALGQLVDSSVLAIVMTGDGTQTLSGQTLFSNYSGGTTINGGTLIINNGGAALDRTSTGGTINNNATATITVNDTTGLHYGKPVEGFTNVFVNQVLSATEVSISNFSGSQVEILTDVTFGATSPTGTGPVTVNNGGTLGGSGFILGATTINGGATLSPGNSTGTLTFASNMILNDGFSYLWEYDTSDNSSDLINILGSLDLNDSNTTNTIINLVGLTGTDIGAFLGNTTLFSAADVLGASNGKLNWTVQFDGQDQTAWFAMVDGNNVILAIPEPGTLMLLGIAGIAGLIGFRRRKR